MAKEILTLGLLKTAAKQFVREVSALRIKELHGVDNGKTIGTYVEHAFNRFLIERYDYAPGSSASGIDFPELEVDLKVTSIEQPQSSCPYRDASQKVYGLGYNLLVFVYDKTDDPKTGTACLDFKSAAFVDRKQTADYQTTYGLLGILKRGGNKDDVIAFLEERNLPLDEIGRANLAERLLKEAPTQGYLTISNALQWRLQYGRVITLAGKAEGIENILA